MIVIFKNEQGAYSVRPAFIGFIKNDIVRRTLCTFFYPFVILFTIALNLLLATISSLRLFIQAVWHPLRNLRPLWKSDIWHTPRTKTDHNKNLINKTHRP